MVGITAYGGYVPRLRLNRKAVADAHAWINPGLKGMARGTRSMANWDEDCVTMAVEAARDCLNGADRATVGGLYFASTTMPFADRQNSGIVATALSLSEDGASADIANSQRAGTTALIQGLNAVAAGQGGGQVLVVASDHRRARAASALEMQSGDGAAALLLDADDGIARFLGAHSVTLDFVDHFRGEGEDFDYGWEERWIRDEGFARIVPRAVKALLEKSGRTADQVTHFVMPCTFAGMPQTVAKAVGIAPEKARDTLAASMGEAGAAHALVMLVDALQDAKPGDLILVAAFGQGCDALLFEVTDALPRLKGREGIKGALKRGREETNYMKYLVFNRLIDWEKGMRGERDNKTALTTLYRKRDMITGLVGGQCRQCGTAQFPRTRICVNPNCKAVDSQDPYNFADKKATILSWSADYLTYTVDPPQHFGMVTFEEGGRFMADFTDVDPGDVESGMEMRMMFRIKDFDERRGFRRYFWKAAPAAPKTAGA
jgi:3-hydroxy-3-methylglutaryl CoA synthase